MENFKKSMVNPQIPEKPLTPQERRKVLIWLAERQRFNKFAYFEPYVKQRQFFNMGLGVRERLLMAGNRVGKSQAGAFEAAAHLTGNYPKWWKGRKFDRPVRAWLAGETSGVVRDVQQAKLCGEPGVDSDFGAGLIPKDAFADKPSLARGVTDAYDTIQVKHISGGISVARFKSYEQGRAKFQGETLDFIWFDEEPDLAIYSEGLTRVAATGGMAYMTFTPLKGPSDVVTRFTDEPSEDRGMVSMQIEDAKHIPPEQRASIIAGYPAHEREARAKGVPMLGSGRIFQVTEESISEAIIDNVPGHWGKIWGVDFGIMHAFAAALLLWDRDNDVIHVHHVIRMKDCGPLQHAVPMRNIGASVPVAWPHDGNVRGDRNTGQTVQKLYKDQGLHMLKEWGTWPDGGFSTEAGIMEMQERMTTGRFKVANHLSDFFDEFRLYHRRDGQIVKERDDILSAVRIGLMMKRYAKNVPLGSMDVRRQTGSGPQIAEGIDFDPFQPFD
jgi:phage terminase large subunit-like protein